MNAKFTGCRQAIETIALKCCPNGLSVKNIVDGSKVGLSGRCNVMGEQFSGEMGNVYVSFGTEDEGALNEIFQLPDVAGPVMKPSARRGPRC